MVKAFFVGLIQKLCFWGLVKACFETRAENKALKRTLKEQQHDLQIASQPCYQWPHLLERL